MTQITTKGILIVANILRQMVSSGRANLTDYYMFPLVQLCRNGNRYSLVFYKTVEDSQSWANRMPFVEFLVQVNTLTDISKLEEIDNIVEAEMLGTMYDGWHMNEEDEASIYAQLTGNNRRLLVLL